MPFSQLSGQPYINLETFRKTGVGVKTPVWFVQDGALVYVRTLANSGKVKRVRNNGKARLSPCKASGELLGEWQDALVRLAQADEAAHANRLLNRKYGAPKRLFDLVNFLRRAGWDTLVIQPSEE